MIPNTRPNAHRGIVRPLSLAAVGLAGAMGWSFTVDAQVPQSLPGIVIAAPPPGGVPQGGAFPPQGSPFPQQGSLTQPPVTAPQQAPPQAAPRPKPKPKIVNKPTTTADASDAGSGIGKGAGATSIAVLVNGEPITGYEIDQRARLMALQSDIQSRAQETIKQLAKSESVNARWKEIVQQTIEANQGKSRDQILAIIQEKQKAYTGGLQKQALESARASVLPGLRDKAKKELIEEQIKLQAAKQIGTPADESAVDDLIKDIAGRNKLTPQQFAQHFAGLGIDIATFKARFRAQLAWTEAIRRRFGHLAAPSNKDIDKLVQTGSDGEDEIELQLQRIVVPIPPKLDQTAMAQRFAEAEDMHRQFANCKGTNALAAKANGSRYENMGTRRASSFAEPTKTMLLNAKEDEMIPPTMTSTGIELIAVCGRKVVKAAEEKRNLKFQELRAENFDRLSRKHLRDLMDSAVIETR